MIAITTTLTGFDGRPYKPRVQANALEMGRLGAVAIASIKARVSRGVGSHDQQMRALSPSYLKWKTKIGGQSIRDLRGPGAQSYSAVRKGQKVRRSLGRLESAHMLDNILVRQATSSRVTIDITDRFARIKARANERRDPWFGFSPADIRNIYAAAQQIFGPMLINVGAALRGAKGGVFGSSAVWLDPLGLQQYRRAA